ncbi:unnamed protein product [Ascophyllum nodosum]
MRKWLPRAYGTHHNTASTARSDKNPTRPLCLRLRFYCTPRRLYLRSRQMHLGPRRL